MVKVSVGKLKPVLQYMNVKVFVIIKLLPTADCFRASVSSESPGASYTDAAKLHV